MVKNTELGSDESGPRLITTHQKELRKKAWKILVEIDAYFLDKN
jgi:hypothetical protein